MRGEDAVNPGGHWCGQVPVMLVRAYTSRFRLSMLARRARCPCFQHVTGTTRGEPCMLAWTSQRTREQRMLLLVGVQMSTFAYAL